MTRNYNNNILFVTTHTKPDFHYGGVVESGSNLISNLRKISKVPIFLICVSKNTSTKNLNLIFKSIIFHRWGFSISLIIPLLKKIYKSDKIFINGIVTFPTTLALFFSVILKKSFIVSIRGGLEPWRRNHKKWKKYFYFKLFVYPFIKHAKFIHTTSIDEEKSLNTLGFMKTFVVTNGIDKNDFIFESRIKSSKKFQFLFLSRTDKEKGIDILLEAYELFTNKYGILNNELLIIGPDNQNYLKNLNIDYSQKNIIHKDGIYANDKLQLMKSVDVFVLPSYSENFGNVIAEALACSTPVITTTGTPWTILNEIGCGLCIDPTSTNLFNAMEKLFLLKDSELQEMGQKAKNYIFTNFLWENKAQEILTKIELL